LRRGTDEIPATKLSRPRWRLRTGPPRLASGELSRRTPAAAVLDLAPTSAEATPTPALVLVRWPWPSAGSSRWHGRLDAAKAATDGGSRWCDLPCASRRRGDALRAPATSHTVGDALQQSQCAANPPSNTRRARPLGGITNRRG
jgi:hypothetical protein